MKESGAHFFEGTEKLLEVWFARQQPAQQEPHQSKGSGDLRTIPRSASRGAGGAGAGEAAAGQRCPRGGGVPMARVWRRSGKGEQVPGWPRWGLGSRAAFPLSR